ncbi:MAG: TatD family hydrolase [Alkalispirochaetaceae bacterium]
MARKPEERLRRYQQILPGMVDSHFHSEIMESRGAPVGESFRLLREGGASWLLDISIEPGTLSRRKQSAGGYRMLRFSTGIHPGSVGKRPLDEMLREMEGELCEPGVVAAGEMGLDWVKMYAPRDEQIEAFRRQLELANRYEVPVIIHNRGADEDVLTILADLPPRAGGIMHCFSSGRDTMEKAVEIGMHISLAGNVTYPKGSDQIAEVSRLVPGERLLLETDAPFLSPQPVRGRANSPVYVGHTYLRVAHLRESSPESVVSTVRENFERLFGLSGVDDGGEERLRG